MTPVQSYIIRRLFWDGLTFVVLVLFFGALVIGGMS